MAAALASVLWSTGLLAQELTIDQVRIQLSQAKARYEVIKQHVEPIVGVGLNGPTCSGRRAYDSDDVRTSLQQPKDDLVGLFASSDARALRDYIEKSFPSAPAGETSTCFPGFRVVAPEQYTSVWSAVEALYNKIENMPSVTVNFPVTSQPSGAHLDLRTAVSATSIRENTTDAELTNVYRGIYVLTVSRNTFKSARLSLNLIDDPPAAVTCSLVPASSNQDSTCNGG